MKCKEIELKIHNLVKQTEAQFPKASTLKFTSETFNLNKGKFISVGFYKRDHS